MNKFNKPKNKKIVNKCAQKKGAHLQYVNNHYDTSLVLVQPRKTRPCLNERLMIGRNESNKKKILCKVKIKRNEDFWSYNYTNQAPQKCCGRTDR